MALALRRIQSITCIAVSLDKHLWGELFYRLNIKLKHSRDRRTGGAAMKAEIYISVHSTLN